MRCCVVIPVYNHGKTLREAVLAACRHAADVIVVDDGSTDGGPGTIADLPVATLALPGNMGKGAAIRKGAEYALSQGFTHMVTMDADLQHSADDLPAFFAAIQAMPHAVVIGARNFATENVPASSRFGRKFSRFWMFLQTGKDISDMQSGFRAYPLDLFRLVRCSGRRYAFETEIIVRAAWAGFEIAEIDVSVYYPPREERVSHFCAFRDNLLISILNARLTMRALMPLPFRRLALQAEGKLGLRHPLRTFRLLGKSATPHKLALSAAWSLLISSIPIIGLNTLLLLFAIGWKKLDRLCALVVVPLTWPPLVPGICVLVGYRLINGAWLTEFSVRTLGQEAGYRLLDWLCGSLLVAPILALAGYGSVYALVSILKRPQ